MYRILAMVRISSFFGLILGICTLVFYGMLWGGETEAEDPITGGKASKTKPWVNLGTAVHSLNGDSQTSNWLGYTTKWDSAANWSTGSIPGSSTKVIIPPSPSGDKFPIIDISDAVAQEVILEDGNITVQTGKLTLESTPEPAYSACCIYGKCAQMSVANCQQSGGTYIGDFPCDEVVCP